MNIKEYLKNNKISVRKISESTGIPYSTLNDILNAKTDIDNATLKTVLKIAEHLNINVEELRQMCKDMIPAVDGGKIVIVNKKYYVQHSDGEIEYITKANPLNLKHLKFFAECLIKEKQREEQLNL